MREAAQAIDELRTQRHRRLPARERAVQALMDRIGRPRFILAVVVFILAWVVADLILRAQHRRFDSETFGLLNTVAQLVSLLLVIGVLSSQNTQGTVERERARLMLQLAVIQDRKITEALNAIEDLRRVNPEIETTDEPTALREATDVHEAAQALVEAERETGEEQDSSVSEER